MASNNIWSKTIKESHKLIGCTVSFAAFRF